jgi:signal transduction histidine kinase
MRVLWRAQDMSIGLVTALYQGPSDTMIGGQFGLARLRDGKIEALSARDYPWLRMVTGIVQSSRGDTWLMGVQGIVRLSTKELEARLEGRTHALRYRVYDTKDGLSGIEDTGSHRTALAGANDRLWFLTTTGLNWIDGSDHTKTNSLAPPVVIRAVVADGTRYRDPIKLLLKKNLSSLEIDYAANSLSIPDRVQFRYKLEGVNADWVNPGPRRQAFYTNLRPGHYRFRVIAANNDGVWNRTGASLEFEIPPTFFQSIWFLLLCVLVGCAFLWFLYSLRIRQISGRLRERLEERVAERERIARDLHDTLLQGIQGLILRFQSVANALTPDQPARRLMDEALDRADNILSDGRDSVQHLRSPGDRDLAQMFADTAGHLQAEHATDFRIIVEGEARQYHPLVLDEIRRIGDEAITNAFRHAKATTIEVAIVYRQSELRLVIHDDGIGIESGVIDAGRQGHFGLVGMRERAQTISAEFEVSSRSGLGTEIILIVPANIAFASARRHKSGTRFFRRARGR